MEMAGYEYAYDYDYAIPYLPSSSQPIVGQIYHEAFPESVPLKKAVRRRRISKKSRLTNFKVGGPIFPIKSLLNRRGSNCFSVGSCFVRLQDYSADFNYFANVIWSVTNHNLIRKHIYVSNQDQYNVYQSTDRYTRWLPRFSYDYIPLDKVVLPNGIGVVLPDRAILENSLKMALAARGRDGIPPLTSGFAYPTPIDFVESLDNIDDITFDDY